MERRFGTDVYRRGGRRDGDSYGALPVIAEARAMPRCIRPRCPGAQVFFTVALAGRGGDLLVREVARLRTAVAATRADGWFGIDAWVVLPDHLDCVWTLPEGDADYSVRWRAIKARFMRGLSEGRTRESHIERREKAVWQRRFWEHHIRDEAEFAAHVRYCWVNPVKQGLVERPEDWPYSSVHRDIAAERYDGAWGP